MRAWIRRLSLYHKFTFTIIIVGLIPMVVLVTTLSDRMISDYREALHAQYSQAAEYVNSSLEEMLDTYNTISKMPYNYSKSMVPYVRHDYLMYDNFRSMVYGENYDPETMEENRASDIMEFLTNLDNVDHYMKGVHFLAPDINGTNISSHYSRYSTYFRGEELFEQVVGYDEQDHESTKMILIPTHDSSYFYSSNTPVFTVARNYFDLRGAVDQRRYVGTLFLDVNINRIAKIFQSVKFSGNETFYVLTETGDCFYSNELAAVASNISSLTADMRNDRDQLIIETGENEFGTRVLVVMNTEEAFRKLRSLRTMIYLFFGVAVMALLFGSIWFSRRLTRPMQKMMKEMEKVGTGNFDIHLPVNSEDEVGVLSERFNQMSATLKVYIDQVYVVRLKQQEAELTALKSQIYPHFLYNTLEIIRMTSLEEGNRNVPEMIEALSQQIHYLIGPVQDMVPLEKELDIVGKYVYLLNCRMLGKVQLTIDASEVKELMIPKLTLQPIVENAYVHGIRPKAGKGNISIEAVEDNGELCISVMDNGIGMDEKMLANLQDLLSGDAPGIKNEYNWQSIGLKNVHDRIRLLYGEQYGVIVTSTPGVGTIVQVRMPIVSRYAGKEEQHDQNDIGG